MPKPDLERLARAYCAIRGINPDQPCEGGREWMTTLPVIRAILQAMREPTGEMRMAGGATAIEPMEGCWTQDIGGLAARECWQAMIDHLLAE